MTRVRAAAPCRVDLAGGTLDIWPLGLLHPGARTVNFAVDLEVEVRLQRRAAGYRVDLDDGAVASDAAAALAERAETALVGTVLDAMAAPPVSVAIDSASPRGAGLGASSALTIALIAAVEELAGGAPRSAEARAALARDLEARLMSLPTGRQDHFPALLGGALELSHDPGGEKVRRLDVDLAELARVLVVAYSGQSHFSAGKNWHVVRRRLDGDRASRELFEGIADVSRRLVGPFENGDFDAVGRLVAEEWSLRSRLADGVSTPRIEELLAASRAAGAWGGKACGAGGGGSIAVLCPPAKREAVAQALTRAGAELLPAVPRAAGLTTTRE